MTQLHCLSSRHAHVLLSKSSQNQAYFTLLYFKGKNLWHYDKIGILLQQFLKAMPTKFDILT